MYLTKPPDSAKAASKVLDASINLEAANEITALRAENAALKQKVAQLKLAHEQLHAQLRMPTASPQTPAERTQAALYKISEASHSSSEFLAVLAQIHGIIGEILPAKNFFVALYDAPTGIISFPYFVDQFDPPPDSCHISQSSLTIRVIKSGKAVLMTPELRAERIARGEQIIGSVCLDWLGVPLVESGGVIGALVIQSYDGDVRYSKSDKALLEFVSTQVASTIVRKRAAERIAHLAVHDALTGLPNRTLLRERAQQALKIAGKSGRKLALLYIDLDKFKPVNDQFGHAVGDKLLVLAAARMLACLPHGDTLARVGGDEFVAVLQDTKSAPDIVAIAEKICAALADPFIILGDNISISSSIGVALYPDHGLDEVALMKNADAALYEAKNAGRNGVFLAKS